MKSKDYRFAWLLPYIRHIDYEGFTGLVVLFSPSCVEWQAHYTAMGFDLPFCQIDPVSRAIGTYYYFTAGRSKSIIGKAWLQAGYHYALPNPNYREPEQLHLGLSDWDYMRYCSTRESSAYCVIEDKPPLHPHSAPPHTTASEMI